MSKKVILVLVDGFEEIEAVTPIDILRRAGLEVMVAGLEKKEVTGSHGIKIIADTLLNDIQGLPEAMVLPGGPGADLLRKSPLVKEWIQKMNASGKIIGAICAAPAVVLAGTGVLDGKKATCFPGLENLFDKKTYFIQDRVVTDQNIVTSRGAGTALEFSLELVIKLLGPVKASEISEKILARS